MSHLTPGRLPDGTADPDTGATAAEGSAARREPAGPGRSGRFRRRYPRGARCAAAGATVLAAALLLGAVLLPDRLENLAPGTFLRLPAEGIALAALLLVLPPRARPVCAAGGGFLIGLLALLKGLDMGFHEVLLRPFDPVLDWGLLGNAADYLRETSGRTGALLAATGAVAGALAVLALTTLAALRLTTVLTRHRRHAVRVTLVLALAWLICVTLDLRAGGVPVAARTDADLVGERVPQIRASLADARVFRRQAAHDAFAHTPPDRLLTGLRGKDVLFTFIESYGRSAIEAPATAPRIGAVLHESTAALRAAGFGARSGWLRSPVTGGGSWLAHATFRSGLWISNQQRFRTLTSSGRTTLTGAFRTAGAWRTVGIMPGVGRAWPEGAFFGLDHVHDRARLGYHGPGFGWSQVPDQFTLEAFRRLEFGRRGRGPLMAEIILTSSHHPWAPVPRMTDWRTLGDGSVFRRIRKGGASAEEVWRSPESVRAGYRDAIEYALRSVVGFLRRYGDEHTVLVFLGDHQPVPEVTRNSPRKDVPVTIVAHDPKVLERISGWGWTEGLKPAADVPVWPMDAFRDRFLTAYGPQPG
ncbi:sulfatase [Streptomyces sp. PBH53]|uniref:sulfatase n=1 Tax=Streptomyces sp. PBH53 TaxID=1577075 RepID=UPI000655D773|nr:sulfatase [Streptomyces sp. PBH53]AKN73159.1 sulfatase [Streptomyces sp. PBH53]